MKHVLTHDITFTPAIATKKGELLIFTAPALLVHHAANGAPTTIDLSSTPTNVSLLLTEVWPDEQPEDSYTLTKTLKFADARITALAGDFFVCGALGTVTIMRAGVRIGGVNMKRVDIDWLVAKGVLTPHV